MDCSDTTKFIVARILPVTVCFCLFRRLSQITEHSRAT